MDSAASVETYLSGLKRYLNDKKILCIPPLFCDNKLVTKFEENAEFFSFFVGSVL